MDEVMVADGPIDPDQPARGVTAMQTGDGWERTDYTDPGDDWELMIDGSYVSPDGRMRTWLLAGLEADE